MVSQEQQQGFIMPVSRLTEDAITIEGKGKLVSGPFDVFSDILKAAI